MSLRRFSLALLLAPFLALLPGSPSRATTQRDTTIEELARASNVIVRGTVMAVTVHATGPGGRPGIHTEVQIAAEEFMAGAPVSVVTLWVHGGRLGSRARVVPGQASFRVGESVIVFLFAASDGILWPAGMARGKWRIAHDVPGAADSVLVEPSSAHQPEGAPPRTITLDVFRARIDAVVRR